MASGIYAQFKKNILEKAYDLGDSGDTIKVGLLDTNHTFVSSTHTTWDATITTNEISGTGYTANGTTLTSQTVTESGGTAAWDAADTAWSSSSFTAKHAVLYNSTVSDDVICSFDFGSEKTVSSGTFTIQWAAAGIITLATA